MRTTKSKIMLLCVLLLSVLITGCLNKTAVLTTLEITPKEVSLDVGQTQDFTVVGKDADGKTFDMTPSWVEDGEVGTVSPIEGKTVTFEATTYGSGAVKVTALDISATAEIYVELTESRVDSFMETSQELFHNRDAKGLGNLYSDPFTVINFGITKECSRDARVAELIRIFESEAQIILVDWEITVNENVAIVVVNFKEETQDKTGWIEWTIKNIEGELFIVKEIDEVV